MAVASSVLIGAGVAAAATAVGGAVAAGKQHKEMRRARNAKERAQMKLDDAVEGRQDIINPYAGVTDLSSLASDLSAQISNPYNNLQVSTAAAEMVCREQGKKYMFSIGRSKHLIDTHKKLGWHVDEKPSHEIIKII